MDYLLSVALFAIASSITPGPNNVMIMTSAVNFGIRKSLPLLAGICVGFTIMLLLVGLGLGQLFEQLPQLSLLIKITGTLYLLYLAWLISKSCSIDVANSQNQPLGLFKGALFQWVNAKAWVVAIGAISAFTSAGEQFAIQNIVISITFFVVSFPCVGIWLIFGSVLKQFLANKNFLPWFNYAMASLLVLSVIPVINDIWRQLIS